MGRGKIIDFLAVGAENAVTGKELAKMLNCHERDITMSINALRKSGVLICSNGSGFFLPKGDEDIKNFIRQMRSRITDMEKALKPAEDYLKEVEQ